MKKMLCLCPFVFIFFVANVFGQARSELNFGLIGVNYEIPVHEDITIAPGASTNINLDWLTLNVKANYYFDNLLELTDESWDVYGGAGAGYAIYNGNDNEDSGFDIGLHVGISGSNLLQQFLFSRSGKVGTQGATGGLGLTVKL